MNVVNNEIKNRKVYKIFMTRTVAQCKFNDLKWILQMLRVEVQFLRDSIAIVSGNFMVWGKKEYLYDAWVFCKKFAISEGGAMCPTSSQAKRFIFLIRPWENYCRFPLTWPGQIFTAGSLSFIINK